VHGPITPVATHPRLFSETNSYVKVINTAPGLNENHILEIVLYDAYHICDEHGMLELHD
jgi:hypothetical protein